jgi:hypothetical protein
MYGILNKNFQNGTWLEAGLVHVLARRLHSRDVASGEVLAQCAQGPGFDSPHKTSAHALLSFCSRFCSLLKSVIHL